MNDGPKDLWRALKAGDRIRLVEFPPEFSGEAYYVHRDTMQVYRKLLSRGRPIRVQKVDENGIPWVECRFRLKDGRWEWHWLAFNHDGLVRVKSRK
jgi:hypothetical protein